MKFNFQRVIVQNRSASTGCPGVRPRCRFWCERGGQHWDRRLTATWVSCFRKVPSSHRLSLSPVPYSLSPRKLLLLLPWPKASSPVTSSLCPLGPLFLSASAFPWSRRAGVQCGWRVKARVPAQRVHRDQGSFLILLIIAARTCADCLTYLCRPQLPLL